VSAGSKVNVNGISVSTFGFTSICAGTEPPLGNVKSPLVNLNP